MTDQRLFDRSSYLGFLNVPLRKLFVKALRPHFKELHIAVVGIIVLALLSVLPVRRGHAQRTGSTPTTYTVIDLGTAGFTSKAFGINNCGSVAGEYAAKPAFWKTQGGAMVRTDIGTLGGADGTAYGLNSFGFVVGGTRASFGGQRAFLWHDGVLTDLGSLYGGVTTEAYSINDSAEVVGSTEAAPNELGQIAFIWDATQGMRQIANGPNGFAPYTARGITNSSHIIGSGNVIVGPGNPPPVETHGFLTSGSSFTDLDTLGGAMSVAEGTQEILGTDYVVGYSDLSSNSASVPYHGFVWHDGQLKDLGTLAGPNSQNTNSIAYDINANGDIVGLSDLILPDSTKVTRAFLWQDDNHDGDSDDGEMKDLTALAAGSNWTLMEAYSINDSGQIVGVGINNQADPSNVHAFLMTPGTSGVLPACSLPPTSISSVTGSGVYGQPATLSATLSSATGPLSGKNIGFSIDGISVCGGVGQPACPTTNASGVATLNITGINAGDRSLNASFAGEANLAASNATVLITISKASATIALSNLTQTYDGAARLATATTNPVGLSGVTISYSQNLTPIASPTNVGSYDVLVTLSNANYQAPNANGTLEISPATATVTITIGDKIYTGVPQGGAAMVTGPGGLNQSVPIRYEGRNGTVYGPPYTEPTNVGEYLAYAEYVNPNYFGASDAKFFKIDKADQTITVGTHAPANASYNAQFTVAATSSSGLTVFYNPSSGSGCISSGTAKFTMTSGTTPCTVVYEQLGNQNYKSAPQVTEVVTAQKIDQTLTFNPLADRTFGELSFGLNATRGASNVPITFSATGNCQVIIPSSLAITGAGSCTVTASEAGNSNYNPAPDVSRSFNIAKANQTISFAALSDKTFGDADFGVSATATSNLAVSFGASGNCTIVGSTVHLTGAGSCTVTAAQAGGSDYNAAASIPRSFNIAKGAATLTLSNLSQIYDGNQKSVTVGTTPPGLIVSLVYKQNGSPVTPVNLGNYDVTATINDTNYQGSASGTLVIHTAAPILVLEEGSLTQLAALDSVTFARGPFRVTSFFNFSTDHHTRIIFFTSNLGMTQPDATRLTVQAGGIPLTVEAVGPVTGFDGSYVIVRLEDGLPTADVQVTITFQNVTSNAGTITIAP